MVKSIINVRRSSICWRGRRGTDNGRQKTQKSWLWRHCRRRAIYWLLRSPSQTCHAKPKTQINRRRTLPASFPLVEYTASSLAWKTSLRKVRTLWHCSRLGAWRFAYDWSWWYPSGNRPLQQYLGFTAGRWIRVSSSIRLTAWLQNSKKRAERSGEIDVWAESPRSSRSQIICIIVCPVMGC